MTTATTLQRPFWALAFGSSLLLVTAGSLVGVESLPSIAFDIWDKAQHAVAFAWLTLCGLAAWRGHRLPWLLGTGLVAWGGLIEVLQAAGGRRHGEVADLVADLLGVVFVLVIHRIIQPQNRSDASSL